MRPSPRGRKSPALCKQNRQQKGHRKASFLLSSGEGPPGLLPFGAKKRRRFLYKTEKILQSEDKFFFRLRGMGFYGTVLMSVIKLTK